MKNLTPGRLWYVVFVFLMGWVGKQGCLWQVLFVVGGWFDCLLPSLFDEGSAACGRLGAPGLGLYTLI